MTDYPFLAVFTDSGHKANRGHGQRLDGTVLCNRSIAVQQRPDQLRRLQDGDCTQCVHEAYLMIHPRVRTARVKADKTRRRNTRVQRYHRRLTAGLCPGCGGQRDSEYFYCKRCRRFADATRKRTTTPAKRTVYQYRYLAKNRRQGLCPACGRKPNTEHIYCESCRRRARKYYTDNSHHIKVRAVTNGYRSARPPVPLCPTCGSLHKNCAICGKMMSRIHGENVCVWTCASGHVEHVPALPREEAWCPRCGCLFYLDKDDQEGSLCCICKRDVEYEARYGVDWRSVVLAGPEG